MGVVTMTLAQAVASRRGGSPVAAFYLPSGRAYTMVMTPTDWSAGDHGWAWTDVARQGRYPLTYPDAPRLPTLQFSHEIPPTTVSGDRTSVQARLEALLSLAGSDGTPGQLVRLVNVAALYRAGWWQVKGVTYKVTSLTKRQEIRSVEVSWELRRAPARPAAGISRTAPPPKPPVKTKPSAKPQASSALRRYTVRKGDTLWKIAGTQLGRNTRWQEIAKLNKLKNPNSIVPGQVLQLPAR